MYSNKIFVLFSMLFIVSIFAEQHSFPVVGVLSPEDEARLTPICATLINKGWQTVVSDEDKEQLKDLISDDSSLENPYVVDLTQENKNKGHLEIKKGSTDVFDAVATGRAVLCRFGVTNGLAAIVFDKEQPDRSICEQIQYQVLQLSKDEEAETLKSEKSKAYSGSVVGAVGAVGVGAGLLTSYVIKTFAK